MKEETQIENCHWLKLENNTFININFLTRIRCKTDSSSSFVEGINNKDESHLLFEGTKEMCKKFVENLFQHLGYIDYITGGDSEDYFVLFQNSKTQKEVNENGN